MSKQFGKTVANVADQLVGNAILGSIGRAAFHVAKVPGVQKAGAYIGENVHDGWKAADLAEKKRKALKSLRAVVASGTRMSPETLAAICKENGLEQKDLLDLAQRARTAAGKGAEVSVPGDGTYAAPETA